MKNEETKTIRYFSMFTGVGGFELGITRSNRNVEYSSQEENLSNSERNKPISQRQQEEINNSTDNREIKYPKNTSGTLFQDRQKQSYSISSNLESTKRNIEVEQHIRQTGIRVLREGNGIRDDSQSMEFKEDSSNSKQFQCVGFSEIDKYANQLLANKFPEVRNYGDATKINASELPDFDMLCGGFPCQSFSIAGKRRGFQDTRGTMFFYIARILEVKRPKTVFLENVKGLLNHDKGETFKVIIQTLSELGYDVQWMVLNSKFFGVPQNRERVFIIGSLRGEPRPEILPFTISNSMDGKMEEQTAIIKMQNSGREMARAYSSEGISPTIRVPSGGWHQPNVSYTIDSNYYKGTTIKGYLEKKRRQLIMNTVQEAVGTRGGSSASFKASIKNIKKQTGKIRRLTPTECERLQGFPDGWTEGFSDTQRYKMMGNAVTVNVIKAIANKLFINNGEE